MTTHDLRERLDELAAEVPAPDATRIDAAWRSAGRRRARAGVAGAVVTVAAISVGSVIVLAGDDAVTGPSPAPAPGTSTVADPSPAPEPTATPSSTAAPVATEPTGAYRDVPVWWAPPPSEDAGLPRHTSAIPATIDLSAGAPDLAPADALLAVHARYDQESGDLLGLMATTPDGETHTLPAPQVGNNRDADGNAAALLTSMGGLSPDGRWLAVAQRSSIEVYDVRAGTWRTVDTADWVAEGAVWLDEDTLWVPDDLSSSEVPPGRTIRMPGDDFAEPTRPMPPVLSVGVGDQRYGPRAEGADGRSAQMLFLSGPVTGGDYSNPEGLVVGADGPEQILAVSVMGRGKGCCSVVGWLDDDLVAFETNGRVLAWHVGSDRLVRVAELTGRDGVAVATSWAQELLR